MAKPGPRSPAGGGAAEEVRARLIEAAVRVLARDGFAHASSRAIATEAGVVNGLIFYHFGSMDHLLGATARSLTERGIARVRASLGGDQASVEWPARLADVIRSEAASDNGRAVMELLVGCRTSTVLATEVRGAIDDALAFATTEIEAVVGDSPLVSLIGVPLFAELAAAAFFGLEVLTQNGRQIDLDRLASTVAAGLQLIANLRPAR